MRRCIVRGALVGALIPGGVASAFAQAGASLSLDDAITKGVANAPRLAAAQSRVDSAAATVSAREALARPSVTTSGAFVRTNHIDELGIPQPGGGVLVLFPDIPNNYQLRADLTVPLFTSGRTRAVVTAATAEQHATESDAQMTAADLRFEITSVYWMLVTARDNVRVVEEALARADANVDDVKVRVDTGFLPPNDLLSAQAQRAREAVALIQAKNAVASAGADLARLVGLDPAVPITPSTALDAPPAAAVALLNQPIAALIDLGRAHRPEREALSQRAREADATGTAAGAATLPVVGATAGVAPERPNELFVPRTDTWRTSWNLGVNVSWQVWDSGKAGAERAAAAAQAQALRHQLEDFDQELAVQIRQRVLDVQSGSAAIVASTEGIAAATEAQRVVTERFKAGVATSTDVLEAQLALLQAELERTQLTAALRISEAQLVRAVGGQ